MNFKFVVFTLACLGIAESFHFKTVARASIEGTPESPIYGYVEFRSLGLGPLVLVTGMIVGAEDGFHGFHIHEYGLTTNGCIDAGAHFNPHQKEHGGRWNPVRHVGDLGNILSVKGSAPVFMLDHVISLDLESENSVINRTLVIHAGKDDLGLGGFPDSKTTGHAGARLGCGVIKLNEA